MDNNSSKPAPPRNRPNSGDGAHDRINADLAQLIQRCKETLLHSEPVVIAHGDLSDLRNNSLPDTLGLNPINLYALWSRKKGEGKWHLQYIGQRSAKHGWARVKQHLFHKPAGTESKLQRVREALESGHEFGVTYLLVEPDYLRLSVEDEVIRQVTEKNGALPWNKRSRGKKPSNGF